MDSRARVPKNRKRLAYVYNFELFGWKVLNAVIVMDFDPQRAVRLSLSEHMLRFEMHVVDLVRREEFEGEKWLVGGLIRRRNN